MPEVWVDGRPAWGGGLLLVFWFWLLGAVSATDNAATPIAAAAARPAPARPRPPALRRALSRPVAPCRSYADHDDADDPMYDEITDIIAGKGGKSP